MDSVPICKADVKGIQNRKQVKSDINKKEGCYKQVWRNLYYKESECDICAIREFCIQKKEG